MTLDSAEAQTRTNSSLCLRLYLPVSEAMRWPMLPTPSNHHLHQPPSFSEHASLCEWEREERRKRDGRRKGIQMVLGCKKGVTTCEEVFQRCQVCHDTYGLQAAAQEGPPRVLQVSLRPAAGLPAPPAPVPPTQPATHPTSRWQRKQAELDNLKHSSPDNILHFLC